MYRPPARALCLLLLAVVAMGCSSASQPAGPRTWIDAPLSGDAFVEDIGTLIVYSHASGEGVIAEAELYVNGELVRVDSNPNPAADPASFQQPWTPPGPGEYTIEVRAVNADGQAGAPATVRITVGGEVPDQDVSPTVNISPTAEETEITPTTTASPTHTPTATATRRPTDTSTPTEEPEPTDTDTPAPTGSISGTVWQDNDGDGVQDGGEGGIEGATVQLRAGSCGGSVVGSKSTSGSGSYSFSNLGSGGYCVAVDESSLPPGPGSVWTPSGSSSTSLSLDPGEDVGGLDFGFISVIQ